MTRGRVTSLGLFEPRIAGDDALMRLAQRRFLQAGLGAEVHAGSPEELEWILGFRPGREAPVTLHLPREFNLLDGATRSRILDFAARSAGRLSGMVLHDHSALAGPGSNYRDAARDLDRRLQGIQQAPMLFIEYAVGLEPGDFVRFFAETPGLERVGCCIDIGHVGIRAARASYAQRHRGQDVCALKSQPPQLREVMGEVGEAVADGRRAVHSLIEAIAATGKRVHFHLHDGHPLSRFSPFGVSDHLSFFTEIPLNFENSGRWAVSTMFGPGGLAEIVSRALQRMADRPVSFTLEIHPTDERLPLGAAADLFAHWTDTTNAEKMNHWLSVLVQNHDVLRQAIHGVGKMIPAE